MQSLFDENVYKTSDFTEVVVLKYFDHTISHIDRNNKRVVFHFAYKNNTDQILHALRNRNLKIEPFSFYQCEREIKSRIYNG